MATITRFSLILATTALLAGACTSADGAPQAGAPPDSAPPAAAVADGLVAGTPPGSLADWVSEVAGGMSELIGQLDNDVLAAQRTALDLYITRQEYIEIYWGAQGRLRGEDTEALSEMVLSAEDAFHDLLQVLAVKPIDAAKVRATKDSINSRLARVLAEARARGVPLIPPGNPPLGAKRSEGLRP